MWSPHSQSQHGISTSSSQRKSNQHLVQPESGCSCLSHACRSGGRLVALLWVAVSDGLISRGAGREALQGRAFRSGAEEMKTAQTLRSSCQLACYLSRCRVGLLQNSTCSCPPPHPSPLLFLPLGPPVSARLFFSAVSFPNGGRPGRLPQESGTVGRCYVLSLALPSSDLFSISLFFFPSLRPSLSTSLPLPQSANRHRGTHTHTSEYTLT